MNKRFSSTCKRVALGLCVAVTVATPLGASARGWGGGHGGPGHGWGGDHDRGGYGRGWGGGYGHGYGGGYRDHGGHWNGGRWIAGALIAGAVVGLVANSYQAAPTYYQPAPTYYQPAPTYYRQQVIYSQPRTVVYEDGPQTQIVTRTTTYGQPTRYVRDDGYDGY